MKASYTILKKGIEITTFEQDKFILYFDKKYQEPKDKFKINYNSVLTINQKTIQSNYKSDMSYGEQHVYIDKFIELHPYSEYYNQLKEVSNES